MNENLFPALLKSARGFLGFFFRFSQDKTGIADLKSGVALQPIQQAYPGNGRVILKPLLELTGREWSKFHSYFRDREIAELNGSNPLRMPLWLFRRVVSGEERGGERTGFGIFDAGENFIGSVEFYELNPHRPRQPLEGTLGIVIGEKHLWGLGYGGDALKVALELAFTKIGLRRVKLETLERNARARRSFEKAGFVLERTTNEARGQRFAHYILDRSRWLDLQLPQ
jgi:RimJ/RimL family protein N-acetyltransferase